MSPYVSSRSVYLPPNTTLAGRDRGAGYDSGRGRGAFQHPVGSGKRGYFFHTFSWPRGATYVWWQGTQEVPPEQRTAGGAPRHFPGQVLARTQFHGPYVWGPTRDRTPEPRVPLRDRTGDGGHHVPGGYFFSLSFFCQDVGSSFKGTLVHQTSGTLT